MPGFVFFAILGLAITSANAGDITVSFGNTVKPDSQLAAFVESFRAAITAKKPDYAAINGMFAANMQAYSRSLDPSQPWRKMKPITANHLDEIIDVIVEQAPLPDDAKQPDYRPEALSMMAAMLNAGPLGKLKELSGSICAPAARAYDVKAAKAFAKQQEASIGSLRFYRHPVALFAKADEASASAGDLPANVLANFSSKVMEPEGWAQLTTSGGITGFARETSYNEPQYLSQMHVCFGKVSGQYKVTGIFGYGL